MKVNGHGGWWAQLKGPYGGHGTGLAAIVHNMEYECVVSAELREYRSLLCGGFSEGIPRFRRVESASFSVCEDSEFFPQALGITEGTQQTFWLKRGELGEFDLLMNTVVQAVRVVNDQKKGRIVFIVCRFGKYLRGVAAPVIIEE